MKLLGLALLGLAVISPARLAADGGLPALGPICGHLGVVRTADATIEPAREILVGYGTGGFPITTAAPRAQAFFDNGMQLGHAFAHNPSAAAFAEARKLDPDCAMCVWGEAWSRGPTINYTIDDGTQKALAILADKAAALAKAHGTAKERALTAALQLRYHKGGGDGAGDIAFAHAMDALARANPTDNELAVIAADAWMIPAAHHNSQANLPRAVNILEAALARAPNDTGAIHFYIHVTEMSGFGGKALPYAERLQLLAPAASHLVHMPSHTYFWVGRYRAAELANLDAVRIDKATAKRLELKDGVFGLTYHGHNVQFGTAAALMDGDPDGALALAHDVLERLPELKTKKPGYGEISMGTAYAAEGRYASQADITALQDPGAKLPIAHAMWRYARGEAAARRGDAKAVAAEAKLIALTPEQLKTYADLAPQAQALTEIARLVLQGRAAMLGGRYPAAADAYRRAADLQDARFGGGGDPPTWWYPVRRSLAEALMAGGHADAAAREARASLAKWPWDPMALRVLAEADRATHNDADAERQLGYARNGWTGDLMRLKPAEI